MKGNNEAKVHENDKEVHEEYILIQKSVAKELQIYALKRTPISKLVQPLLKIPPSISQRLKRKNKEEKFKKVLSVFKTLTIFSLYLKLF